MAQESQYTNAALTSMQSIFGEGFLSPGGPEDVEHTLQEYDLSDANVLDLGCGLGGATCTLAGALNARHVTAADIEPSNIAVARDLVERAGLSRKITFQQVSPGPLPMADNTFDIVYCTAVICHIPDKAAFFREPRRVLSPGGVFLGADWMTRADSGLGPAYETWVRELANADLDFTFETADAHARAFRAAGFETVHFRDGTEATIARVEGSVDLVEGSARDELLSAMGEAAYESFKRRCVARIEALRNGDLQYKHFFAS